MRLLALTAALALSACSLTDASADSQVGAEVAFDGVVTYAMLEGGAWVLVSDEGETYEPVNLDAAFETEGLRVRVTADVLEDRASTLQVGPIIEISTISAL